LTKVMDHVVDVHTDLILFRIGKVLTTT